ncbi:MAG: hypothetical protein CMM95_00490 [Rickettsiales bacterium]|nr:hypothetical protein [Rickettsiales bacterium]
MRLFFFTFFLFFSLNLRAIEFKEIVTEKGIKFWFVEDKSIPLVSLSFSFSGGAVFDPEKKEGTTNLMTSLLDEGTENFSSLEYKLALKDCGAKIAFTTHREKIDGSFRVVSSQIQKGFWLLQEVVNKAKFDQNEIEKVKKQLEASIKIDGSDVSTIASDKFNEDFFLGESFSRKIKGSIKSLKNISRKDIYESYLLNFNRNFLKIGIAGDIDEENAKKYIDYIFGDLPQNGKENKITFSKLNKGMKTYNIETPQSTVIFGKKGLSRNDKNFFAARIVNYVLGGGSFQSRLYKEVREKRGLVYSISTYLLPYENDGLIMGVFQTRNETVNETIDKVKEEWDKILKKGISKKEFNDAKTYYKGSFSRNFTSTISIANLLKIVQYYNLGKDYFKKRDRIINDLTLKQVNEAARNLFKSNELFFVIVGKLKK